MFKKAKRSGLLLLALSLGGWGLSFAWMRASDVSEMKHILEQEHSSSGLLSTIHQERSGVAKEIWFTQEDGTRLQYLIQSKTSHLAIAPQGGSINLVENLRNIHCALQEKLYLTPGGLPMQQMRFLEAEEGLYSYSAQQFSAQSVILSLFRLPGHDLPHEMKQETPFLKGVAEDVSFAVSGKTPQFNAKQFKAQLNPRSKE